MHSPATETRLGRTPVKLPCTLCGETIVWVYNRTTRKRITINPLPAGRGVLGRVHPREVDGNQDVVEVLSDQQLASGKPTYTEHLPECEEWAKCKAMNMSFSQCLAANTKRHPSRMSQSAREAMQPDLYKPETPREYYSTQWPISFPDSESDPLR